MNSKMKSLKARAKEFTTLLPFMEGRDKGEFDGLLGNPVTITDYGFLTDTDNDGKTKEYACFTIKEDPVCFYFGGKVITENLQTLEAEGYHEAIVNEGLPVLFETKKSKNKRDYTAVTFYPEAK